MIKLKTALRALKSKLQAKTKRCKTDRLHYCPEKAYSSTTYSTLLGKTGLKAK